MAKKEKINVKGLKISEILDIDLDAFNRLNESQLRALTSRLISAGNKRIRLLKKHNINSPAVRSLKEEKFTTKLPSGTDVTQRVNKLRATFSNVRNFLSNETSTIGGYKKFVNRTKERLSKELNMDRKTLDKKLNVGRLFDLLHKAQNKGLVSSYRHSQGSMQARNIIAEILVDNPDVNEDTLMDWLEQQSDELYEQQELEEEFDDETEEFEL